MKYKAEIYMMTELFIDNDKNQGCDPDSMADNGLVYTIVKNSKIELLRELNSMYGEIEHYEEHRYETGYETTERDGIHESVMVSIYVTRYEEEEVYNLLEVI